MADNQFSLLSQRRFLPFFLTQALGAFNDNVFKNALVILIAFKVVGLSSDDINFWSNLAAGLFILPFFLFSASAGQWAEKNEKSGLIRKIKLLEVFIMLLAAVGFWLNSLPFLLGVLFLMGLQSTLFGPVKYSVLPQLLKPGELLGGNALVEAGTFLAILLGTLAGGALMALFVSGTVLVAATVIAIALAGYAMSRAIPAIAASAPDLRINLNPFTQTLRTLACLRGNRAVLYAVLGVSWFWFFGATFLAQIPNYTREFLGGNEEVAPLVLTLFSLGIGVGSLLCERLSGRRVEIGLVPLGALGLTVFAVDLYFARPLGSVETGMSALQFLAAPGNVRVMIDLLGIGLFGGFYIVPLYALIQSRADPARLSRIIAANNILNALFMVVAALLAMAWFRAGLNIPQVFALNAILNVLVAIYIFSLVPEFTMRFMSWLIVGVLYRLRTRGTDLVPDDGPALVVCNHVSFVDALIVMGAVRRPIRFVMYHKIFRIPVLRWIFRIARAIPIAPAKEDAALMERAFAEIDAALAAGEVVGIFPEGQLTLDGEIGSFRSGVERILAARPVPVVAMALRGMWRSMWSRRSQHMYRARLPRRFRARVELVATGPIAADQASASALEAIVRELRGEAA
ncbi:MAG: glycerol acyltransferase [Lysobacterales bacterium CG17_big_fil_post_rev_8_21_14_2_50_64_11]|nr:MAG: glycerol acyltransferase [Xanthomonadales bacterium CG17_big_fil_post_rev_8_21_14_2_50_64_11]PIX59561.1 MAG: glycerol acyltransferase [Xanthomonadales bacterium CG_4_10_14_3_um_filter_64_11]